MKSGSDSSLEGAGAGGSTGGGGLVKSGSDNSLSSKDPVILDT